MAIFKEFVDENRFYVEHFPEEGGTTTFEAHVERAPNWDDQEYREKASI